MSENTEISELQILKEFKQQLVVFFDQLIGLFPTNSDLVIARIFLKDQIPVISIMKLFILRLLPLKEMIYAKDSNFFINNNNLFEELDMNKVNQFKKIWRSTTLDDDDREAIWKWFFLFITFSEKYQKCQIVI